MTWLIRLMPALFVHFCIWFFFYHQLPPNGSEPDPEKLLPVMFWQVFAKACRLLIRKVDSIVFVCAQDSRRRFPRRPGCLLLWLQIDGTWHRPGGSAIPTQRSRLAVPRHGRSSGQRRPIRSDRSPQVGSEEHQVLRRRSEPSHRLRRECRRR